MNIKRACKVRQGDRLAVNPKMDGNEIVGCEMMVVDGVAPKAERIRLVDFPGRGMVPWRSKVVAFSGTVGGKRVTILSDDVMGMYDEWARSLKAYAELKARKAA